MIQESPAERARRYNAANGIRVEDAKRQLTFGSDTALDHLVKLYLFPSSEKVTIWRSEVWHNLKQTSVLNTTRKYPEARWIYDILWGTSSDDLDCVMDLWDEVYNHTSERMSIKELRRLLDDFYTWASDILSVDGRIASSSVRQKLEELGL